MLTHLKISFSFYRKFIWVSVLLNLLFLGLGISFFLALIYKLVLTSVALWIYQAAGGREQLIFYHNLKLSTGKLFFMSLSWDLMILTATYVILEIL